ncbi:sigma-54 dependent transcriptional regulator [candidate division KSB1 bacterium]|nr:sigma-54 dependent transcriptional regulator [candidate division KSB1 bacterium]
MTRSLQKVQQYFDAPLPETALLVKYEAVGLLGRSKKFIDLLHDIEAAAPCDVRVVLEGQSGAGKELVAHAIHHFSLRCDHPFIAIDCGAIAPNLIESELFGHVKGAFTSAASDRKGLLADADQGTLFMDEIPNLPLDTQAKFMRVLQAGEVRPVGSNKTCKIDVRIISACSMPLHQLVEGQKFREDLYYRLHVYPIHIPSLDERPEDIPLLANHFLKKFAAQQHKQAESFHATILDFMQQRHWPGNIRELENFVERLVTLAPPQMAILDRDHLPPDLQKEMKKLAASQQPAGVVKPLYESLAEYEEQLIRQALNGNHWNIPQTARVLRIAEQTLRNKMTKRGIIKRQNNS